MSTAGSAKQVDVKVRRAPKFGAFIVVGAVIALLATLIVTALFPTDPSVGYPALVAYFSLFTIPAGVALAAVIALIVDRRSSKRATTVVAAREDVEVSEEVPVPEAPETTD